MRLPVVMMRGRFVSVDGVLFAHSPAGPGRPWHRLDSHLRGTADLAARFARPFGGAEVAYWLGLLHDVGKASCAWQGRLAEVASTGGRVGLDHKALGTRLAIERGLGPFALAVWGHHGGLVDASTLMSALGRRLRDKAEAVTSAETAVRVMLPELSGAGAVQPPAGWLADPHVGEMAMRLVFSALCDADHLDTAAHFHGLPAPLVQPDVDLGVLRDRFEKRRTGLFAERSMARAGGGRGLDGVREQVYAGCVRAAAWRPGVFRLPAPTGAGKTLASAGFALHHGAEHGMRRVVVAVPFLTITEQNAAVYRAMLDDDAMEPVVLEHHSGVDLDLGTRRGRWARLAAENWDAPFVVTTFVRLFESLFGRRPAAMRRVHRLAGAVIVLDEVQALPVHLLVPILDGLRRLVEHFGATVVLCSATQPEFWALSPFKDLPAVDLVDDPGRLAADLRRVAFQWRLAPKPTLAQVAAEAAAHSAALVVVNTTADARRVYDAWRDVVPAEVAWHLSTRMCPAHRRRVLDAVRQRLDDGAPVLLVSTQLVEAGVDVDFPVVFRALAPADSLLQAAGRANREGRLPGVGQVVIFDPADGGAPPSYRALVGQTLVHLGPGRADPDDQRALAAYYRAVYDVSNLADDAHLGQRIQQARARWELQTVTDGPEDAATGRRDPRQAFRLISDTGLAVVTPQGAATAEERAELVEVIERIRTAAVPTRTDLRRLQQYTTTIHPSAVTAAVRALLAPVLGGEVGSGGLVEWRGEYDDATGIDVDPRIEEFVI